MVKVETIKLLKDEWAKLSITIGNIPNHNLELAGSVGEDWSINQCVIHIAAWDEEVMNIVYEFNKHGVSGFSHGDFVSFHNINDKNEDLFKGKKQLDPEEALAYLTRAHENFMSFLESLPEPVFDTNSYTGKWIGDTVPQHYIGHRQDIEHFDKRALTAISGDSNARLQN